MRFKFFFLLVFLSLPFSANSQFQSESQICKDEDKKWYACEKDGDCTIISDPCGWPRFAISKNFSKEGQKCNQLKGAPIACAAYNEIRDGKWTAKCTVKRCISVKQQTDPKIVCEKAGGVWDTFVGRGHVTGCNLPTKDAGKKCLRGEDCESVCLKDRTCYGFKEFRGCAFFKGDGEIKCVE